MSTQEAINTLLENLDLESIASSEPVERACISFWVPVAYKEKFEIIQDKSNKRFGKLFQEVLKSSIDKVKLQDKAG